MESAELCKMLSQILPDRFACSPAPKCGVRVRTPLLYPDGQVVDVFVVERDGNYIVTDYGDALGWLRIQSAGEPRSQKQESMVQDVCRTWGIELERGQLALRPVTGNGIQEAVARLAKAVARVSAACFGLHSRALR